MAIRGHTTWSPNSPRRVRPVADRIGEKSSPSKEKIPHVAERSPWVPRPRIVGEISRFVKCALALGCTDWFTARVETLGELDAALKAARESKSGAYIEVIGGRMDMPKGLAFAHTRLKELYGDTP